MDIHSTHLLSYSFVKAVKTVSAVVSGSTPHMLGAFVSSSHRPPSGLVGAHSHGRPASTPMPLLGATPHASGQGEQSIPFAHAFDIICVASEAICQMLLEHGVFMLCKQCHNLLFSKQTSGMVMCQMHA